MGWGSEESAGKRSIGLFPSWIDSRTTYSRRVAATTSLRDQIFARAALEPECAEPPWPAGSAEGHLARGKCEAEILNLFEFVRRVAFGGGEFTHNLISMRRNHG